MARVGKKIKMLKSPEYNNFHELLSQEWINGKYRTSKQNFTSSQTYQQQDTQLQGRNRSNRNILSCRLYRKLEIEKRNMARVGKKIKMLKSPEYNNFHELLSQEWINGKYRTSKQNFTSSQTYQQQDTQLQGRIRSNRNILSCRLYRKNPQHPQLGHIQLHKASQEEPLPMKIQSEILKQRFRI